MRDDSLVIRIAAWLVMAAGVALGIVRFFGESPPGQNVEAAVGAAAFGAVIAAPGVLALLALRDRPALLLPAALVLVPLSFLSFALVTLPLLIPAFLLVRACARRTPRGATWRVAATTFLVVGLLAAALIALFLRDDPRAYVMQTAVHATSDVITYAEAALSLSLTSLAVAVGWWLSRIPRRSQRLAPSPAAPS